MYLATAGPHHVPSIHRAFDGPMVAQVYARFPPTVKNTILKFTNQQIQIGRKHGDWQQLAPEVERSGDT